MCPPQFEVPSGLPHALDTGTIQLGDVEGRYERLVAEALAQGRISEEERERLYEAAKALGLDPDRAERLEAALRAAQTRPRDTLVDVEELVSGSVLESPRGTLPSLADSGGVPAWASLPPAAWISDDELHARFAIREDTGDVDGQWRVASALVRRGQASARQEAFFLAHRTKTPPKPRRALTPETWRLVFDPTEDPLTSQIFNLIARPTLIGRVAAMRADKTLQNLSASQLQDPKTSTISAVRAIGWASATLGMTSPPIYVDPSLEIALEFVANVPPATRIGSLFLAGQSTLTLAFQAARHMTWYRQEHYVCTLIPTIDHLSDLFLGAVLLGAGQLDLRPEVRARVSLIADALRSMMDGGEIEALRVAAQRFLRDGGRTSLANWAKAAASTASRAGLLLSGDLETACSIVSTEVHGTERAMELETFWASDDAGIARRALGIEIGPSTER